MKILSGFKNIMKGYAREIPGVNLENGYDGYIEKLTPTEISGWCVVPETPLPTLELYAHNRLIAKTVPFLRRPDVENKYSISGFHGFKFHLDKKKLQNILEAVEGNVEINYQVLLKEKNNNTLKYADGCCDLIKVNDIKNILSDDNNYVEFPFLKRFDRLKKMVESEEEVEKLLTQDDVKLIAYYLPQFHPFVENNEWWGEGFTEWTNVTKAEKQFTGHYQPRLPADLGFYDLRLNEIREQQAKLARKYGIHGFCYYYYWFSGKKIMDTPINMMLESGKPDFPFCICWANEPWSRRWDGSETDVLLPQHHDLDTDEKFILDVLPFLQDPRYIRINGAPIIIIYRVGLMPNPSELFRRWRILAAENGIDDLHIVMAETFGDSAPMKYGCDAAVEFPPHAVKANNITTDITGPSDEFKGNIYNYQDVVVSEITRVTPDYTLYRGIMPSWDNTARKGKSAHIFHNSSPELYGIWLRHLVTEARDKLPKNQKLVFINAWNEWAEGAYLEPDRENGHRYLQETYRSLATGNNGKKWIYDTGVCDLVTDVDINIIKDECRTLKRVNEYLSEKYNDIYYHLHLKRGNWRCVDDKTLDVLSTHENGNLQLIFNIETINGVNRNAIGNEIVLDRCQWMELKGWVFSPDIRTNIAGELYLIAVSGKGSDVMALVRNRFDRPDVAHHHNKHTCITPGFEIILPLDRLIGKYELYIYMSTSNEYGIHQLPIKLVVI